MHLQRKEIVPFALLLKNDNSEKSKIIKKYKNNISSLELIHHIREYKIDLDNLDHNTQNIYQDMIKDVD